VNDVLDGHINVSLFCGGRGSSAITRELLRWPNVNLSLLVNAYDDGLSTGELREFIPGMLGPSDFRKSLSHLLDLYSSHQYALQKAIEYRLPIDFSKTDLKHLEDFCSHPRRSNLLTAELGAIFLELDREVRTRFCFYMAEFFKYYRSSGKTFRFGDCSLGNLLFAGAYLHHDRDFNAATRHLSKLLCSQAQLINVSKGDNCTLVALKEDGQILYRESEVVGPQSSNRIDTIFLLRQPLTAEERESLEGLSFQQKRARLHELEVKTEISEEAREALLSSHVIIYGPGTQFSSLMPSYKVFGLPEAVRKSQAVLKLMVANLKSDHDIQGLTVVDVANKLLEFVGDPKNEGTFITHILYNRNAPYVPNGFLLSSSGSEAKQAPAAVIESDFENPVNSNVHSGYSIVHKTFELLDRARGNHEDELDIYIDLLSRSIAVDSILQEFVELPWQKRFGKTRLCVNRANRRTVTLPKELEFTSSHLDGPFTELDALRDWLVNKNSEYLVTLTGDGEYRLRDILVAVTTLNSGTFGAVHGSRTQSRRQFGGSLRSAYGEGTVLFWMSWLGAFVLTTLFALRFRIVFSDTLTGFRIYKRSRLNQGFREALLKRTPISGLGLAKLLIQNHVEIAEIPVTYRTFRGFTKVTWRLQRALRNAMAIFF